MKKLWMSIFIAIITVVCLLQLVPFGAAAAETKTVTVKLSTNEDDALMNYITLRDALKKATSDNVLKIVLSKKGKYYIDTTGAALIIRSNTIFDLNGSTLVRSGTMLNQNMFQNADLNGNQTLGKYSLSHDITITNGAIDGAGDKAEIAVNLINIGHADKVVISQLEVSNVYQGHLIELSGCRNVTVEDCVFNGFYGKVSSDNEAIQLDISKKGWNNKYLSDSTICRNITVKSCTFNNVPTGVGNHHTFTDGYHNKNITISGNKFNNMKKYSTLGPAVYCVGFDNSIVKNNSINGYYSDGIKILCGSVEVFGNKINTKSVKGSSGIYMTVSSSYIHNEDDEPASQRSKEYVKSGKIYNNTISGYGNHGITINSKTVIEYIRENKITGGKGNGINISDSTVKKDISNNEIKNCIYSDNNNLGSGIRVTSNSLVPTVKNNNVTSCDGYGIEHYSKKVDVCVINNKLKDNKLGEKKVSGVGTISPAAVTGLKATNIKCNQLKLEWNKEKYVSGYRVYKYDSKNKKWIKITDTKNTNCTIKDLKAGTSYKYAVRAFVTVKNKTYWSAYYPTLTASTKPTTPKLKVAAGTKQATLSWNKISGATGYEVYMATKKDGKYGKIATIKKNATVKYTKKDLKKGTTYYFKVRAYKTFGGKNVYSAYSAVVSAKIK
ncbi:MAG: fibronectin type III domain-containing protein [Ruminococcus sp.]|nr:fibronectin type III domain-containing protein [Ruminococcus sp.]